MPVIIRQKVDSKVTYVATIHKYIRFHSFILLIHNCIKAWRTITPAKIYFLDVYDSTNQFNFIFQMKQIPVKEETDPNPLPHLMILTLLADYCRQFLLDFIKENDTSICCTKVKCGQHLKVLRFSKRASKFVRFWKRARIIKSKHFEEFLKF